MNTPSSIPIERLEALIRLTKVQCQDGNWNFDPYMRGMANGMILAVSTIFNDAECPTYFPPPDHYIVDQEKDSPVNEKSVAGDGDDEENVKLFNKYVKALHDIKEAMALEVKTNPAYVEPAHLRMGIVSTMVTDHAMTNLLIDKGVFTIDEYFRFLTSAAEQEAKEQQDRIFLFDFLQSHIQ